MRPPTKTNPRAEFRRGQIQRANESVSLTEKFPELKSLRVDLTYFDSDGVTRTGEWRYTVNVKFAKSVFSFVCPCGECIGGDFDLSAAVADAVSRRKKIAQGEIRCEGWRIKPKQDKAPCQNLMRYKISLGYGRAGKR
jgi:hypothetical protein